MSSDAPDAETLDWVTSVIGPHRIVSRVAHGHGYSQLWRIEAAGEFVWLKMHAHPHKWAGEVHALTRWPAPLAPTVLGWRAEPRAVLLTERPGLDADSLELDGLAEEKLWTQAGEWLRQFHARTNAWFGNVTRDGGPHGKAASDPTALLTANFELRTAQASERGLLSAAELDFARGAFRAGLPSLVGAQAHSVHRDFHPRNWLADTDGTLTGVIDFEHARWDVRAFDLTRPWDKEFQRNPRLVDAFYEGYGRPDATLAAQVQLLRLHGNVTSIVWAVDVGDTAFAEASHAGLLRMMGGSGLPASSTSVVRVR